MTRRHSHAVRTLCRLMRLQDMPASERQPPPRWRSTNERLNYAQCYVRIEDRDPDDVGENVPADDLPGD